jgi:hypothetical protein
MTLRTGRLCLVLGGAWAGGWEIVAYGTNQVVVPRKCPWGMSVSINTAVATTLSGSTRLEVHLQSGDVITVEAASMEILPAPEASRI